MWQAKTGRMCVICDPEATKLFPSYRSLMRHLEMEHQKQLCEICMKVSTPISGCRPVLILRRHNPVGAK